MNVFPRAPLNPLISMFLSERSPTIYSPARPQYNSNSKLLPLSGSSPTKAPPRSTSSSRLCFHPIASHSPTSLHSSRLVRTAFGLWRISSSSHLARLETSRAIRRQAGSGEFYSLKRQGPRKGGGNWRFGRFEASMSRCRALEDWRGRGCTPIDQIS